MTSLIEDANLMIKNAIESALPDTAVNKALDKIPQPKGKIVLISVGKAAWQMANAAYNKLESSINCGVVITKYGHSKGQIGELEIYEAGHPVSDDNTFKATERALEMVQNLNENDLVLFLLSGGGSALFEKPLVKPQENQAITKQLLACGANIVEMNIVRKRLSAVKGGKFAQLCEPAHVYTVVLSDIIGDPLDMIASGPAYPDSSTCEMAISVIKKYGLEISEQAKNLLFQETPKKLDNVTTFVTGSVKQLCSSASKTAKELGYSPIVLTSSLDCEAKEAGAFLASIARDHQDSESSLAFIAGGETIVHLKGNGKGGRNQEIALSGALGIKDCNNTCLFSFGSDGTDGPTDAAGGYVDNKTYSELTKLKVDINEVLQNNDAYNALQKVNGLIMTGATGTNVNDLSVLLIKR